MREKDGTGVDTEIISRLLSVVKVHKKGISTSAISRETKLNRNSVAKYLEILRIMGEVDVNIIGNAKIYTASKRMPVFNIINKLTDMIVIFDDKGKVLKFNTMYESSAGINEADCLSKSPGEVVLPFFPENICELVKTTLDGGSISLKEITPAGKNSFYLSFNLSPVVLENGKNGVLAVFRDITLSRGIRDRYLESKKKYDELFNRSEICIFLKETDCNGFSGKILDANEFACDFLGRKRKDILNKTFDSLISKLRVINGSKSKGVYDCKKTIQGIVKRPDGTETSVSIASYPFLLGDRRLEYSIIRDISPKKLKELSEKYENSLKALTDSFFEFLKSPDSSCLYASICERLAGFIPGSLIIVSTIGINGHKQPFIASTEIESFRSCMETVTGLPEILHNNSPYFSEGYDHFDPEKIIITDVFESDFLQGPEGISGIFKLYDVFFSAFSGGDNRKGSIIVLIPKDTQNGDLEAVLNLIRMASVAAGRNAETEMLKSSYLKFEEKSREFKKNLERANEIAKAEIFARINSEKKLSMYSEMLLKCFEEMNFAIMYADESGNVISANKGFSFLTGYSEVEIVGKNWIKSLIHSEYHDEACYFHEMVSDGIMQTCIIYKPAIDSSGCLRDIIWIETGGIPVPDCETKNPVIVIGEEAPGNRLFSLFGLSGEAGFQ